MSNGPYKRLITIKWIAAATLICFAAQETALAAPGVASAPTIPAAMTSVAALSINQFIQQPAQLDIPFNAVTLQEVHVGTSGRLIIHIQDAHANLSGQQSLAKAVEHFAIRYGLKLVLVEGADRDVTLDPVRKLAPLSEWSVIARRFLYEGIISGEEYVNLTTELPIKLRGIEYQDLYDEAVKTYAALVDRRKDILHYLYQSKVSLDRLKVRMYPQELKDYEAKKGSDDLDNGAGFAETLKGLFALLPKAGMDLTEYPSLAKLKETMDREAALNFERANREQVQILGRLKPEDARAFAEASKRLRYSQVSQYRLTRQLLDQASERGLEAANFPELKAYAEYLERFLDIKMEQVMVEQEKLEDQVFDTLLPDDDARKVRAIDRFLGLLGNAYKLQMSSHDFKMYEFNESDFPTESWLAFMNRKLADLGFFESMVPTEAHLEDAYGDFKKFYRLVSDRDGAFLENTQKIMAEEKTDAAVLIAGGYHTDHLTQLLRDNGDSYVVLTPLVTDTTDQEKYENILLQHLKNQDRQLAAASHKKSGAVRAENVARSRIPRGIRATAMPMRMAATTPGARLPQWVGRAEAFYDDLLETCRNITDSVEPNERLLENEPTNTAPSLRENLPLGNSGSRMSGSSTTATIPVDNKHIYGGVTELPTRPSATTEDSRYLLSGWDMTPTPKGQNPPNPFVPLEGKELEERSRFESEIDFGIRQLYDEMGGMYGFLSRDHSLEAASIYAIFDKIIPSYNRIAEQRGQPPFRGKFFLVDSPQVSAFVPVGRDDVFMSIGLIRILARYLKKTGEPLSEDHIAAIMAHELAHVMQHSTYAGLDRANQHSHMKQHERVSLIRNAERDADRTGSNIIDQAGISSSAMIAVMDFLDAISSTTTSQTFASDHPHPKERIANLLEMLNSDSKETISSEVPRRDFHPSLSFEAFPSDHVFAEDFKTDADIIAAAKEIKESTSATDIEARRKASRKMVELIRIAKHMGKQKHVRSLASSREARVAHARSVFEDNILILINMAISKDVLDQDGQTLSDTEAAMLRQPHQLGGLIHDVYPAYPSAEDSPAISEQTTKKITEYGELRKRFRESIGLLKKKIISSNLSIADQTKILKRIESLVNYYESNVDSIDEFSYESGVNAPILDLKDLSYRVFSNGEDGEADTGNDDLFDVAALDELTRKPYSTYVHFGKQSLNRVIRVSPYLGMTGLGEFSGEAHLTFEDSAIFQQDVSLMPLDDSDQRADAYDVMLISWLTFNLELSSRYLAKVNLVPEVSRDVVYALRDALVGVLPDEGLLQDQGGSEAASALTAKDWVVDHAMGLSQARYLSDEDGGPNVRAYLNSWLTSQPTSLSSEVFVRESGVLNPEVEDTTVGDYKNPKYYENTGDKRSVVEMLKKLEPENADALTADERDQAASTYIAQAKSLLSTLSPEFRHLVLDNYFSSSEWASKRADLRFMHPQELDDLLMDLLGEEKGLQLLDRVLGGVSGSKEGSAATLWYEYLDRHIQRVINIGGEIDPSIGGMYLNSFTAHYAHLGQSPDAQTIHEHLLRLSQVCVLEVSLHGPMFRPDEARSHIDQLTQANAKLDQNKIGFFFRDGEPYEEEKHRVFTQIMGMSLDQLLQMGAHQRRLLAKREQMVKGTFSEITEPFKFNGGQTRFFDILNNLILHRTVESHDPSGAVVSPDSHSAIVHITYGDRLMADGGAPAHRSSGSTYELRDRLLKAMKGQKNKNQAWKNIFRQWSGAFIPYTSNSGTFSDWDYFFERLIEGQASLIQFFPDFRNCLNQLDFASGGSVNVSPLRHRATYRHAVAGWLFVRGARAKLFGAYVKTYLKKKFIRVNTGSDFDALRADLENGLGTRSSFRDGFIDIWERQLFPEMHRGSRIKISEFNPGDLDKAQDFFKLSLVETPLQWRNIKKIKIKLNKEKMESLIKFYFTFIPLVHDLERRARYGATAMLVWRALNPAPDAASELDAIMAAFPDPSLARDHQLGLMFNAHAIGSAEAGVASMDKDTYLRAAHLRTEEQGMEYNRDGTNVDAMAQYMRSALSSASRNDRKDVMLWLLDPRRHPLPENHPLRELDRRSNIDVSEIPHDARYMPEYARHAIIDGVMMGENGLFNVEEGDAAAAATRGEFIDEVFEHYFSRSNNQPSKSGLKDKDLKLIHDIFRMVLEQYDQARAASIIKRLMDMEDDLLGMTYGERLVVMMDACGPVGVKVGQVLSENRAIITHRGLRSELKSLQSRARPFSKSAVVNSIMTSGLPFDRFVVGRRLGSASMGQVHEGFVLTDEGRWEPVVFKVLRPSLNRMKGSDLRVLENVLERLKTTHGIDTGNLHRTITRMLNIESDFNNESSNSERYAVELERLPSDGRPIRGPEIVHVEGMDGRQVLVSRKIDGHTYGAQPWYAKLGIGRRSSAESTRSGIRKAFMAVLFGEGIAHGDLHPGNAMSDDEADYMIDLGFMPTLDSLKSLGEERFEAGKNALRIIMKSVVLGDAAAVSEGVSQFVEAANVKVAHPDELQDEVVLALQKRSIDESLKDIGFAILRFADPDESTELSKFIKALAQSSWLFAVDLIHGVESLSDIARNTGMNPAEYRQAIKLHLPRAAINTVMNVFGWAAEGYLKSRNKISSIGMNLINDMNNLRRLRRVQQRDLLSAKLNRRRKDDRYVRMHQYPKTGVVGILSRYAKGMPEGKSGKRHLLNEVVVLKQDAEKNDEGDYRPSDVVDSLAINTMVRALWLIRSKHYKSDVDRIFYGLSSSDGLTLDSLYDLERTSDNLGRGLSGVRRIGMDEYDFHELLARGIALRFLKETLGQTPEDLTLIEQIDFRNRDLAQMMEKIVDLFYASIGIGGEPLGSEAREVFNDLSIADLSGAEWRRTLVPTFLRTGRYADAYGEWYGISSAPTAMRLIQQVSGKAPVVPGAGESVEARSASEIDNLKPRSGLLRRILQDQYVESNQALTLIDSARGLSIQMKRRAYSGKDMILLTIFDHKNGRYLSYNFSSEAAYVGWIKTGQFPALVETDASVTIDSTQLIGEAVEGARMARDPIIYGQSVAKSSAPISNSRRPAVRLDVNEVQKVMEGRAEKDTEGGRNNFMRGIEYFNETVLTSPVMTAEHCVTLLEIFGGLSKEQFDERAKGLSDTHPLTGRSWEDEHALKVKSFKLPSILDLLLPNPKDLKREKLKQKSAANDLKKQLQSVRSYIWKKQLFDGPWLTLYQANSIKLFARYRRESVIESAAKIYRTFSVKQRMEHLNGFDMDQGNEQFPQNGHHRLAWFIMNYYLIRNGYSPFYFASLGDYLSENQTNFDYLVQTIKKNGVSPFVAPNQSGSANEDSAGARMGEATMMMAFARRNYASSLQLAGSLPGNARVIEMGPGAEPYSARELADLRPDINIEAVDRVLPGALLRIDKDHSAPVINRFLLDTPIFKTFVTQSGIDEAQVVFDSKGEVVSIEAGSFYVNERLVNQMKRDAGRMIPYLRRLIPEGLDEAAQLEWVQNKIQSEYDSLMKSMKDLKEAMEVLKNAGKTTPHQLIETPHQRPEFSAPNLSYSEDDILSDTFNMEGRTGQIDAIRDYNLLAIYFSAEQKKTAFNRYAQLLKEGGYLMVGRSSANPLVTKEDDGERTAEHILYKKVNGSLVPWSFTFNFSDIYISAWDNPGAFMERNSGSRRNASLFNTLSRNRGRYAGSEKLLEDYRSALDRVLQEAAKSKGGVKKELDAFAELRPTGQLYTLLAKELNRMGYQAEAQTKIGITIRADGGSSLYDTIDDFHRHNSMDAPADAEKTQVRLLTQSMRAGESVSSENKVRVNAETVKLGPFEAQFQMDNTGQLSISIDKGVSFQPIGRMADGASYMIGRGPKVEPGSSVGAIKINDPTSQISRTHAQVTFKDGRLFIQNHAAAANGTSVGKRRLKDRETAEIILKSGARLTAAGGAQTDQKLIGSRMATIIHGERIDIMNHLEPGVESRAEVLLNQFQATQMKLTNLLLDDLISKSNQLKGIKNEKMKILLVGGTAGELEYLAPRYPNAIFVVVSLDRGALENIDQELNPSILSENRIELHLADLTRLGDEFAAPGSFGMVMAYGLDQSAFAEAGLYPALLNKIRSLVSPGGYALIPDAHDQAIIQDWAGNGFRTDLGLTGFYQKGATPEGGSDSLSSGARMANKDAWKVAGIATNEEIGAEIERRQQLVIDQLTSMGANESTIQSLTGVLNTVKAIYSKQGLAASPNYHNHLHNLLVVHQALIMHELDSPYSAQAAEERGLELQQELFLVATAGLLHDFRIEGAPQSGRDYTPADVTTTLAQLKQILQLEVKDRDTKSLFDISKPVTAASHPLFEDSKFSKDKLALGRNLQDTAEALFGDTLSYWKQLEPLVRRTDFPSDTTPIKSALFNRMERKGVTAIRNGARRSIGKSGSLGSVNKLLSQNRASVVAQINTYKPGRRTGGQRAGFVKRVNQVRYRIGRVLGIEERYYQSLARAPQDQQIRLDRLAKNLERADQLSYYLLLSPSAAEQVVTFLRAESVKASVDGTFPFFVEPQLLNEDVLAVIGRLPTALKNNFVDVVIHFVAQSKGSANRLFSQHPSVLNFSESDLRRKLGLSGSTPAPAPAIITPKKTSTRPSGSQSQPHRLLAGRLLEGVVRVVKIGGDTFHVMVAALDGSSGTAYQNIRTFAAEFAGTTDTLVGQINQVAFTAKIPGADTSGANLVRTATLEETIAVYAGRHKDVDTADLRKLAQTARGIREDQTVVIGLDEELYAKLGADALKRFSDKLAGFNEGGAVHVHFVPYKAGGESQVGDGYPGAQVMVFSSLASVKSADPGRFVGRGLLGYEADGVSYPNMAKVIPFLARLALTKHAVDMDGTGVRNLFGGRSPGRDALEAMKYVKESGQLTLIIDHAIPSDLAGVELEGVFLSMIEASWSA